eukprot:1192785-Prorocentrum_minimum.AAC.3
MLEQEMVSVNQTPEDLLCEACRRAPIGGAYLRHHLVRRHQAGVEAKEVELWDLRRRETLLDAAVDVRERHQPKAIVARVVPLQEANARSQ